jgi:hypothetical protein
MRSPEAKRRAAEAVSRKIKRRAAIVGRWKQRRGCADCGWRGHPAALDLDHVRGDKVCGVAQMYTYSWDRVKQEIAKCEVVCANCHRIRTYERKQ